MIVKINGKQLAVVAPVGIVDNSVNIVDRVKVKGQSILYSAGGTALVPMISAYMDLSKYLTVAVIMFAGTCWMFGHRTKAIELLIGAAAGFLIILYAWDMVSYLEGLKKH